VPLKTLSHKEMPRTARHEKRVVSSDELTAILAERIMRWGVCPERFLLEGRSWLPRWRFQPLIDIDDAFQLLSSSVGTLVLTNAKNGSYVSHVKLGRRTGRATSPSAATSITVAIARALTLDVPDEALTSLATKPLRWKRERPTR
jgi:hypothetical protein